MSQPEDAPNVHTDPIEAVTPVTASFVAGYVEELWSLIDDLASMLARTRTGIVYDNDVEVLMHRYQDTNRWPR